MKKIIAVVLAIIVIMSLGCVCFADKTYNFSIEVEFGNAFGHEQDYEVTEIYCGTKQVNENETITRDKSRTPILVHYKSKTNEHNKGDFQIVVNLDEIEENGIYKPRTEYDDRGYYCTIIIHMNGVKVSEEREEVPEYAEDEDVVAERNRRYYEYIMSTYFGNNNDSYYYDDSEYYYEEVTPWCYREGNNPTANLPSPYYMPGISVPISNGKTFTTANGECYHNHDCGNINGGTVTYTNPFAAQAQGYRPCEKCY